MREFVVFPNAQAQEEFKVKVFELISASSGKYVFSDMLAIVGQDNRKQLHRVLAILLHERKITRIRGFGTRKIESFYHDVNKLKPAKSHYERQLETCTQQ